MAMIVPGRGWSVAHQGTGQAVEYTVLGPLAERDYLARVTVSAWASADAQLNLGFSLGPVGEASALAFGNGVPLISRGVASFSGMPLIDFFVRGHGGVWLWVPVGIRGSVGSRFIIAYMAFRTVDVNYSVLIGAEVLRFTERD